MLLARNTSFILFFYLLLLCLINFFTFVYAYLGACLCYMCALTYLLYFATMSAFI